MSAQFYQRSEWQRLRYRVLRKYGFKCMACSSAGVQLHVDHIMPISIYPERALDESNLQVLCKDCNLGKSNTYTDDHRPKPEAAVQRRAADEDELIRLISTLKSELMEAEKKGDLTLQSELMKIYLDVQRNLKNGTDTRILMRRTVAAIVGTQFDEARA